MNVEQLTALRKRAEKATEVAKDIELLQAASPRAGSRKWSFVEWNTNEKVLPDSLLRDVIESGRLKLMEAKERELSELLG